MQKIDHADDVPDRVLGRRDVLVVDGPDALSYLHSQASQDLRQLGVGAAAWSFVLDPSGRIVALFRVRRVDEQRFELDTDAGFGESLVARLERFKIRVAASIALVDRSAGPDRDEAARIEFGWPAMGAELVPGETLVASTGLAGIAVNFRKGCYPGQELVERMDSRAAQAPRRLCRVTVPAGASAGDPVVLDGVEVGTITSVVATSALAMVQRGVELGEPVDW